MPCDAPIEVSRPAATVNAESDPALLLPDCPLCVADGGQLVLRRGRLRVVVADEPGYPAFTRVIWDAHVAEMTDLDRAAQRELLDAVLAVEAVQRRVLAPDKINLATLGNQVPHLHWHVIPRWRDDLHFPAPVWAPSSPSREAAAAARSRAVRAHLDAYVTALRETLGTPRR